ncbi:37_t:CDS:2, partial [Paraglomus brasilianum]
RPTLETRKTIRHAVGRGVGKACYALRIWWLPTLQQDSISNKRVDIIATMSFLNFIEITKAKRDSVSVDIVAIMTFFNFVEITKDDYHSGTATAQKGLEHLSVSG